jgi:cell division protein FtsZ
MIHFDLPKQQSSIIKVIGVGGGGSNAVNYMYDQSIDGVDFIICNTDAQALTASKVPNKIQLGPNLTQGLGAGANPQIGRQATEESLEEVRRILEVNTKMVFVTAGMGGGTGTGGAPIVARMSQEMGILTVGIVTTPFSYEGKKRLIQALEGIEELKKYVDTLLIISNDKLRHQFGNLTMRAAFSTADNVLATAAKCITDVIGTTGQINVDFADVCTVMRNGGKAILGNASAEGENRAHLAIEQAMNSPLLDDNDIRGAKWILININSSEGEYEFTMDEVEVIQQYLLSHAGPDRDVILGLGYDNTLGAKIGITLIATGFENEAPFEKAAPETIHKPKEDEDKVVFILETSSKSTEMEASQPEIPEAIATAAPAPEEPDAFAPILVDLNPIHQELPKKEEKTDRHAKHPEQGIFLFDQGSITLHHKPQTTTQNPDTEKASQTNFQSSNTKPVHEKSESRKVSGGFLSKPSNIYAQDQKIQTASDPYPLQESQKPPMEESDPDSDMQLVIKENSAADDSVATSTHLILASAEEPALQDEVEEQKRKAAERLHKLRNLSFNLNTADPNNEYEHVPAFIRRKFQETQPSFSSAEQFYSNYTVKSEDNNQGQLSSLNNFLEGKKPD